VPFERPESSVTFRLKEDMPTARIRSSYRISPQNFARLNPAIMQPVLDGQKSVPKGYLVRLPATKQAELKIEPENPKQNAQLQHSAKTSNSNVRYMVRKGDTILSIARQFQLSPQELLAANSRNRATAVRIGDKLIIPVKISKK
jgi:membrane-bound lytic murein transglycosylase D